jgi:hypothetical protein
MTPDAEFAEAVRRLHRAKDAAYRDAWKRRGEVLSILANIARKVDRLEYGLGSAPAAGGETQMDTVVDLLVYCLKYQAYLADIGHETTPLSDGAQAPRHGPAAFEALLSRADLASLVTSDEPAAAAARRVVATFAELEACFAGLSATQPTVVRLARVQALTSAAIVLAGALRHEHPQAYAAFISSCLAME